MIYLIRVLMAQTIVLSLYYCPMFISVNPTRLTIGRLVVDKHIPVADIESATPYQRTMNFVRTCGSRGFMGFWGWYRNQELRRFFVYGGNLDRLVLITLKSGRKYVVSCTDAATMADKINESVRTQHCGDDRPPRP